MLGSGRWTGIGKGTRAGIGEGKVVEIFLCLWQTHEACNESVMNLLFSFLPFHCYLFMPTR